MEVCRKYCHCHCHWVNEGRFPLCSLRLLASPPSLGLTPPPSQPAGVPRTQGWHGQFGHPLGFQVASVSDLCVFHLGPNSGCFIWPTFSSTRIWSGSSDPPSQPGLDLGQPLPRILLSQCTLLPLVCHLHGVLSTPLSLPVAVSPHVSLLYSEMRSVLFPHCHSWSLLQ